MFEDEYTVVGGYPTAVRRPNCAPRPHGRASTAERRSTADAGSFPPPAGRRRSPARTAPWAERTARSRLPATSVCTVVEDTPSAAGLVDDSYAWDAPSYNPTGGQLTLSPSGANTVTVTNTTSRVYGSFQIAKILDLAGEPTPDLVFTGTWTCTHPNSPDVTGTWRIDGQGTDEFSGILVGSQCEVVETTPPQAPSTDPSYVWDGYDIDPASVTVTTAQEPVEISLTNHTRRQLTFLAIRKVLTGDTAGEPAGQTYEMTYTCLDKSGATYTDNRDIAAGETWNTARIIPLGSRFAASEVRA